ncbi:hypothetical protein BDW59DRAFT_162035 [Aspergillus cavernicola]|uniref:Ankyrin repeat-containing domain protein n=1 Tax=Aspergillus cavernicola TaxID=176166 RepID=A0ABR4IE15_9EURO
MRGYAHLVRVILSKGANPNRRCKRRKGNKRGETALCLAAIYGRSEVVLELLSDGTPPESWRRPAETTVRSSYPPYYNFIDTWDNYQHTPLYFATSYSHVDIVRMLLARGSTAINTPSRTGVTPLKFAEEHRHEPLEHGDNTMQRIFEYLSNPSSATMDAKSAGLQRKTSLNFKCADCKYPLSEYAEWYQYCENDSSNHAKARCYECAECRGFYHCKELGYKQWYREHITVLGFPD